MEVAAIAGAGYPVFASLGATYRFQVEGSEHLESVLASGRQPILAFWHGRILSGMIYFRDRGIIVITSDNFDGEWIARIIQRFGFGTARGSSSRGGQRALIQMKRDMANGKPVAFTLDGPRGPARVAQPGAVYLAKITGNPVVPFHMEAERFWTVHSWDRTQVPKPWSRISLVIGEPFEVPSDTDAAGIDCASRELERRLADLEQRALRLVGRA